MLELLAALANFFSHSAFDRLHEWTRRALTRAAPWFFRRFYGHEWVVRHSAAQPGTYHFLYSDLDLALVLQPKVDIEKAHQSVKSYLNCRGLLPFLGELEIYFADEWSEKRNLEKYHGKLLRWVRDRRKEVWVLQDLSSYDDRYHLDKAQRSLQKIRRTPEQLLLELETIISPRQMAWLQDQKALKFDVIPFYGRKFPDGTPPVVEIFLALIAPHYQDPRLPLHHPFEWEKSWVGRYEVLCYRGYLRSAKHDILASNDWLEQLVTKYRMANSMQNWQGTLPKVLLSEVPFKDQNMWGKAFTLVFEPSRRFELHLKEQTPGPDLLPLIEIEERWLAAASLIEVSEKLHSLWLAALFPHLVSKIIEKYRPATLSVPKRSRLPAATQTISVLAPFSKRFGSHRLNRILNQLEYFTADRMVLEVIGPASIPEEELAEFLNEMAQHQSQVVLRKEPTGVIILPTIYHLPEDQKWIEAALASGRPVVSGYDAFFEERIVHALKRRKNSVVSDFPMFRVND